MKLSKFAIGRSAALLAIVVAHSLVTAQAQTSSSADSPQLEDLRARLARAKTQLEDWPNLERYREANTTVAAPAKDELRVVFMGDSITDLWAKSPQSGGFFLGKPYLGRGIGGQTTPQMLVRFRPDVIALSPRIVVILAGTNDIAGNTGPMTIGETEANLASMAELARVNGIKVVLASILPVSSYGHSADGTAWDATVDRSPEKILALNEWIKKYAADHRLLYLDYFSEMVDGKGMLKRELSEDGLHPNRAGYAIMAPLAEQAIQAALKNKR